MKECCNCKYEMNNNCSKNKVCIKHEYFEQKEYSSVEIRLFNHENGSALYENLTQEQLDYILQVLNPKNWIK